MPPAGFLTSPIMVSVKQFYESESPLSIRTDHCMCINVIKGECNPQLPFYTAGGSFYINHTSRFLATVPEEDKGHIRNVVQPGRI